MINILIQLFMVVLLFFGSQTVGAESSNRIVAIVNDEIITFYELEKAKRIYKLPATEKEGEEESQKQLLFQLIDQKLIDMQIKKLGVQISSEEVDKAVARIREDQKWNNPEDFARALLREGFTESEFKNKIKEQILRFKLISREIGSKIIIPENQVREYYEKNRSQFRKTEGIQLAHIFWPVPENASSEEWAQQKVKIEEIRSRLLRGEDFSELARKFSKDPSAAQGGNLGLFAPEEIEPLLRNIIVTLKPGEVSEVIRSPKGWQIIKLIDLKVAKDISFEEAKDRINEHLFQEEVDKRFTEWLQKIKDRSYIQVLL
jgi:peptidyl-prolyl cis-trans isomerase SurA